MTKKPKTSSEPEMLEIRKLEEMLKQSGIKYGMKITNSRLIGKETSIEVYSHSDKPMVTVREGRNTIGGMVDTLEVTWAGKTTDGYQKADHVFDLIQKRVKAENREAMR